MSTSTKLAAVVALVLAVPLLGQAPPKATPSADRANAQARLDAAHVIYDGMIDGHRFNPDKIPFDERIYVWSRRWMDAQRDLAVNKEAKVKAAEEYLERMQKGEKHAIELGWLTLAPYQVKAWEFYRLEAEHWLAEAKAK
jgi:hypothetical protein